MITLTHPPGDPSLDGDLTPEQMTWSVIADQSALVKAVVLDTESPPVFGFVVQEADRSGSISIPRCDALKIAPGESRSHETTGCGANRLQLSRILHAPAVAAGAKPDTPQTRPPLDRLIDIPHCSIA